MIPFLVEFADKPADDDDEPVTSSEEGDEHRLTDRGGSTFHTRCGHPRRRDD